ncbi:UNVERIFIED_CONTAM: hypothetical protein GTU68_016306, partial [Idotea baltica]|nr:hypothetical protein [Idotea baltica]
PVISLVRGSFRRFPTPRNLELYLVLPSARHSFLHADCDRSFTVLCWRCITRAERGRRIRTARAHHAATWNFGWMLRYLHTNGASMFFIAVYITFSRSLLRVSDKAPREISWILGTVIIFLIHDGPPPSWLRSALGPIVLLWARTVITNLFSALPLGRRYEIRPGCGAASCRRQSVEPVLLAALPAAVHDLRRGDPARLGLPHDGQQQPDGRSAEDQTGYGAVPSVLYDQGPVRDRDVHDPVRLVRLLRSQLHGASGQLHRGEPAGDAGAYRAGMVLPAVLRDPARGSGQARWRPGHVRRHRDPVRAALAGHVQGPLRHLPSAVQAVLLDLRPERGDPGLSRSHARRRRVCHPVPDLHHLLFRPLPCRLADARVHGETAACAGVYLRSGA